MKQYIITCLVDETESDMIVRDVEAAGSSPVTSILKKTRVSDFRNPFFCFRNISNSRTDFHSQSVFL